ncbi:MAG: glycoside hydrolase family 2 protein [Suipraeoptans sp.]
MRNIKELRENWRFVKSADSPRDAVEKSGLSIKLPHTWNNVDGQDGGNDYYRGTCWYTRELKKSEIESGKRTYLEFLGVAMTAKVYINESLICEHDAGYSTFRIDITDEIDEDTSIVVEVNNDDNDRIYPQKADFTFYGGLYRMVNLITTDECHFDLEYNGSTGIKVTPEIKFDSQGKPTREANVLVETWIKGNADTVSISILGAETKEVSVINGKAQTSFNIYNAHLWNGVKDPYLYTAVAELNCDECEDKVEARFGIRTFKVDSEKGFMLNGESYPLRGVSRHQDRAKVGNALTYEMHKEDMEMIKEIGANTIRLAHYQHAQEFYDLCDEYGMVVWAEIPLITMFMVNGVENTLISMKELVIQNYNHASIVCWGLSNEITAARPVSEALLDNHRQLNDLCHTLDKTRFTTIANVFMQETDSPLLDIPDVNSYNLYFGWYLGELNQNDEFFDEFHEKYPNRCIGFSEYGADANPQFHSITPTHGDYTESYQCIYHEHILNMIEARPYLWATHVWNMFDFAADGRDEGGKHGENQKGLVTLDRKIKKDAFYLYKAYWNKYEDFVHVCGSRYVDRKEENTQIKVYSNCLEVSLYVDDNIYETKEGKQIFEFTVPISSKHKITAKSGSVSDEIHVNKVQKLNPEYIMGEIKEIVNWFDDDEYKPDYYSVKDRMSELQSSPKAGVVLAQLMDNGVSARGDVAESVKDNPNLVRMMGRMTLESMLGHMKDSVTKEQITTLNHTLQQIKKGE